MKKIILVSIIFALTTFTAISQTKQESIKKLFSLMKTESMLDNFVIPFQGLQKDSTSEVLMNSLKPMLKKIMDEDMVELYDKYYSEKEIKDFIRFYKTKTGQKLITTSPELQKEIMNIVQTKFMGEFMKSSIFKSENTTITTKPRHLVDSASIAQMKKEYLDLDTSNFQNATSEQKLILLKAIDRMDPYVKYENKVFSFTATNANELNMSERLFNILKGMMGQSNSLMKYLNVAPDKNDPMIMRVITDKKE